MAKPTEQLKPINGYLTYTEHMNKQDITISTIDDDIAEKKETFSVMLFSPKGGARLDKSYKESRLTGLLAQYASVF